MRSGRTLILCGLTLIAIWLVACGGEQAPGTPPHAQSSRSITGIAVLGPTRIALTAGNAIIIRTLP